MTPANEVRLLQYAIAVVFLTLGAWCLVAPESVVTLTVRTAHQSKEMLTAIAIAAFGAQAMLAGLFAAFSTFTRRTFFAFGVALLPFFVFDWWFYVRTPVFNEFILLDAAGNIIMVAACVRGWLLLRPSAKRVAVTASS